MSGSSSSSSDTSSWVGKIQTNHHDHHSGRYSSYAEPSECSLWDYMHNLIDTWLEKEPVSLELQQNTASAIGSGYYKILNPLQRKLGDMSSFVITDTSTLSLLHTVLVVKFSQWHVLVKMSYVKYSCLPFSGLKNNYQVKHDMNMLLILSIVQSSSILKQ